MYCYILHPDDLGWSQKLRTITPWILDSLGTPASLTRLGSRQVSQKKGMANLMIPRKLYGCNLQIVSLKQKKTSLWLMDFNSNAESRLKPTNSGHKGAIVSHPWSRVSWSFFSSFSNICIFMPSCWIKMPPNCMNTGSWSSRIDWETGNKIKLHNNVNLWLAHFYSYLCGNSLSKSAFPANRLNKNL